MRLDSSLRRQINVHIVKGGTRQEGEEEQHKSPCDTEERRVTKRKSCFLAMGWTGMQNWTRSSLSRTSVPPLRLLCHVDSCFTYGHKRASWALRKQQRRWCKWPPGKQPRPTLFQSFKVSKVRQQSMRHTVINVKCGTTTYQAHQHNDQSQFEVLHAHGPCQVTTCCLKCDWLNVEKREQTYSK